jgi:hypothetical protein
MNPDYRSLGENRRHRWDMPNSPIIRTFKNGRPLTLEIKESETFADKKFVRKAPFTIYRDRKTSNYHIARSDSAEGSTPAQPMGKLSSREIQALEDFHRSYPEDRSILPINRGEHNR